MRSDSNHRCGRRGMISSLLTTLLVTLAAMVLTWSPVAQAQPAPLPAAPRIEYAPNTALVKLQPGVTLAAGAMNAANAQSFNGLMQRLGVSAVEPLFDSGAERVTAAQARSATNTGLEHLYRIQWNSAIGVEQAVAALSADAAVAYAEPDYIARPALAPNDPLFAQQWWAASTHLPLAWDATTGALTVTIAVVDGGIDLDHPDLQSRLWTNPGEIADNGVDDDNNGFVDDFNGWDFVYASNNLQDENGHGTEVAGVAAATGSNGQGIAGVCWGCRIMPVKVMQPSGVVNYSALARGIAYAAAKGAHVINLSVGGYADSKTLHTVIQDAALTAVIVAGAGNDSVATPFYPAAYPEVLAVAATDESGQRAALSNYGNWVDLAAPGVNIVTTFDGGTWGATSGTSVAAPVVSGVAGLVKSLHPNWTSNQVAAHVRQTAAAIATGSALDANGVGAGLVDAAGAVQPPQIALVIEGYALNDVAGGVVAPNSTNNQLVVQVRNTWYDAGDVHGQLSSSDPAVTVVEGAAAFGTLATGVAANSPTLRFNLGAAAYDSAVPFMLTLTSDGGAFTQQIVFTVPTAMPRVAVNLPIAGAVTWSADHTYVVSGDVPINAGAMLTIQPGTTVRFAPNAALTVSGALIADGTESQPISLVAEYAGHELEPHPVRRQQP